MARINIGPQQVQKAQSSGLPVRSAASAAQGALVIGQLGQDIGNKLTDFADRVITADANATATSRIATAQQEFDQYFNKRSTVADQFSTLEKDTNDQLAQIRERALNGVTNDRAKLLLDQRLGALETSAKSQAITTAQTQQIQHAISQTNNALAVNADNAANAQRPEDRQRIVDDSMALIDSQVKAGLLSSDQGDKAREAFLGTYTAGRFEREIAVNPYQALKELSGKPVEHLSPAEQNRLRRSAQAEVNTIKATHRVEVKSLIDDVKLNLENGFMHPQLEQAMALVKQYPEYANELSLSMKQYGTVAEQAARTPQERRQWIDRQRARTSMETGELRTLQAVEGIDARQQSLINQDPLRWGTQTGRNRELPPLDFTNMSTLAVQLSERRAVASFLGDQVGEPVSPLYKQETAAVLRELDTGSTEKQVSLLGALHAGTGDQFVGLLHQLDKQGESTYAQIGALVADGNDQAALQLAQGRKIVKATPAAAPKDADFRALALSYLGDSFDTRPRDRDNFISNARLLYTGRGGDPIAVDEDKVHQAIDSLTGGQIDYHPQHTAPSADGKPSFGSDIFGSQKLPAPAPGVTGDDFTAWVRTLTEADIKQSGGVAGFEDNPEQVLRWIRRQDNGAQLVSVGRGLYGIQIIGLDGNPQLLLSAKDPRMPFMIDWEDR